MLVVAGSRGKTGAAHLAAVGALRSGAGLVTVATPACCQPVVAAMGPEYMTEGDRRERRRARSRTRSIAVLELARDVVAIGPGLGQGRGTRDFIRAFVDRATMPLVIDADGLNAFTDDPDRLTRPRRARRDHHAASRRDGAPGRHVDRRSAGEPPRDRAQLCDGASRLRRPEGPPHADRDAGRQGVHQPDRATRAWRPAAAATC